jgi:hypothetical protein
LSHFSGHSLAMASLMFSSLCLMGTSSNSLEYDRIFNSSGMDDESLIFLEKYEMDSCLM